MLVVNCWAEGEPWFCLWGRPRELDPRFQPLCLPTRWRSLRGSNPFCQKPLFPGALFNHLKLVAGCTVIEGDVDLPK